MTWEVRAVDQDGTLVSVVEGVSVGTVHRAVNGDEYADLTIPTLHPDAGFFDLFDNEVQLWLDGSLYFWGRPARLDASRESSTDQLSIRIDGLFSYFFDEFVGGERVNHIVSPHEDAATVGNLPNSWEAVAAVELHAVVGNNWEFWTHQKAIQVNNSVTDADAYIFQRFTVPAELDGVPFAAMATCYISDNQGGSPAWGGPALNERGLMIHRLDGATLAPISGVRSAKITEDTPRNALVRLQTRELIPRTGDVIEVRLYAPDAWTAWRFVGLYDGRWEGGDGIGKAAAFTALVEHAQDTALGKQDRGIGVDATSLGGETVNKTWPWWRRDNIGEQLRDLADTFEFDIAYGGSDVYESWDEGDWNDGLWDGGAPIATVRAVRVRRQVGTDRTAEGPALDKQAFVGWGLGSEITGSASRIIMQGQGQGIARDEWWVDDPTALNGNVREILEFDDFATLAQLQDRATTLLTRAGNVDKIPRARIVGTRAVEARPGDRYVVDLNHGAAVYAGEARAMAVDFDGVTKVATLHLEPVE